MSTQYESLYSLLKDDEKANEFFLSLPEYAREQMSQRASSINSFESLQDYAQNILRGDD